MSAVPHEVALAKPFRVGAGMQRTLLRIGTGVLLLVLWELLVRWLAPAFVARPVTIAQALPHVLAGHVPLATPPFWGSVEATLIAVFEGLAIGVVGGILVGLTMGRLQIADRLLRFYVNAFFAMPILAMVPLMVLWLGFSSTVRLAIVSLGAFLPICLNVYDGTRSLPSQYVEVAKTYHARWWNVWFGIALPASLPYVLAGFRLAVGRALVGATVAEYVVSLKGLGYLIVYDGRSFHQPVMMVAVLFLALLGVAINAAADFAMRRLLPWYRR
ncbi:MAG TPA: ABC transporter permease, partial [Casimicrobiaceae bacterium]|nr:ABC transporter permease [Casimicrobiaceae bacterium]